MQSSKQANEGNVMVVCRFRPFNEKEIQMGETKCVAQFGSNNNLELRTQVRAQSV